MKIHDGLGAITSSLAGNDAMSRAIAGVAGELIAEIANENGAIINLLFKSNCKLISLKLAFR